MVSAMNVLLWGAPKIWYSVPPSQRQQFQNAVRSFTLGIVAESNAARRDYFTCAGTTLQHRNFVITPEKCMEFGVDVVYHQQKPGDIVLSSEGAIHWGANMGPNAAISWNCFPADDISWAYLKTGIETTLSFDRKCCGGRLLIYPLPRAVGEEPDFKFASVDLRDVSESDAATILDNVNEMIRMSLSFAP